MKANAHTILLALILLGAGILLYEGWKLFWFLTDDAFIAFRYVNNSIAGYGYTWNPPPFRPVEGYTCFLWVVLLDFIWRVFDLTPPEVVNYLSLGFSYLTLGLVTWVVMRMKLHPALDRFRLVFLSLILAGTLSNRTFLAWTSSGMETAMFNFFFTLWLVAALLGQHLNNRWLLWLTGSAALTYLTRPDGLVAVFGTLLMLYFSFRAKRREGELNIKWLLFVSPLIAVPVHLFWRKSFYGEWLPNTFYAKVVAPWPEAGLRYFASFILEYALWIWFFLLGILVYTRIKKFTKSRQQETFRSKEDGHIPFHGWPQSAFSLIAISVLAFHTGYYTLVIGGDHFEYRIYSHLIPFIFISFLWTLNALNNRPKTAIGLLGLFILLSLPLPWTHWMLTKNKTTRKETWLLAEPVRDKFPSFLQWYPGTFDRLQSWLVQHNICLRHQEHKIFLEYFKNWCPPREEGKRIPRDGYPVLVTGSVGIPGWVFPNVAILDQNGLTDYVIARSPFRKGTRLMAHERIPPPGYLESFLPNISVEEAGQVRIQPRQHNLTANDIIANEAHWTNELKIMRAELEQMSEQKENKQESTR
ncbi:MAG: hypothetical protein L0196_00010 [candidate division Zixibacteria bacterium]|nr:hypothetical protein [candidate division Zixibacteria bacterium]